MLISIKRLAGGALFTLTAAHALAGQPMLVPVAARYLNDLPAGFASAVYDAPLAVRVEVDGRYMADAMVVLDRNNHVTLTQLMAGADSPIPLEQRNQYEEILRQGLTLGSCSGIDCPGGIVRSALGIADSKLALYTDHGANADAANDAYLTPPMRGSGGAVLSHGLSLVADPGDGSSSLNYDLSLSSNLGNWTAYSDLQIVYEHYRQFGSFGGDQWRKYLNDAYLQKESRGYYLRAGIFTPDNSTDQGNLAPLPYSNADTIAGFAIGSSDTLLQNTSRPSMIPLTVNANRSGRVEIYKDGRMLLTQAVQPGVNNLPTENLPNGIYSVELRLYENNQLVSSTPESIYKPSNWDGQSRWRFRVYGGRRFSLWDGAFDDAERGDWAGGAQLGYLLTPRLRGGITVSYDGLDTPVGLFLDYQFNDNARLYANPYYSSRRGSGYEIQGTLRAGTASIAFTHRYADRKYSRRVETYGNPLPVYADISRYSSLVGSWQVNEHNRLSASLRYDHVHAERTMDLSYYRDLLIRNGTQVQAFASVYDRPAAWSGFNIRQREHGVMVGLTGTFGSGSDQFNVSTGAGRTAAGLDRSLDLGYQHNFTRGMLQSLNLTGNYARGGSAMTAAAQFATRHVSGDGYVQYVTSTGDTSLGLNLRSTTAIGGWAVGEAASDTASAQSMVMLDIGSDGDVLRGGLIARLNDGSSIPLHTGRNLIPVDPYRTAYLSFDQSEGKTGGLRFQPDAMSVQLYPGGVVHRRLVAIRTITVVGRVVDTSGQPRAGVRIVNHASQAWPESDGVFTMEVSRQQPSIEIFDGQHKACGVDLKDRISRTDASGVAVLGDVKCE